jgi:DNA-binding Lrp family transcriptional regulator
LPYAGEVYRLCGMLTEMEKQILWAVQGPLELCDRPFAAMAGRAGCSPSQCVSIIGDLKAKGFIRRYSAIVNYAVLGRAATLATASVPQEKLAEVIAAVNALPGVSHHYLRKHVFNLWFTLQSESPQAIEKILLQLSRQTGERFYSLPAERFFKLAVRFCPEGPSPRDFEAGEFSPPPSSAPAVFLTEEEKKALRFLQADFPITETPFESLCQNVGVVGVKQLAEGLVARQVICRIAVVLDYRKLGYNTNVLACFAAPAERIEPAAYALSARPAVSHCYQRRPFAGWPYNLFAMIHAGAMEDVEQFVSSLAEQYGICEYVLLPTERELKKAPVLYE